MTPIARRLLRAAKIVLMLAGGLLAVITFTPLVEWAAARFIVNWTDSDGDVLVVLCGGAVRDPGYPNGVLLGDTTYWRAVHAIHAWRTGHFRSIVLVGEGSRLTLKPFLMGYGVPEPAMIFEERSVSTHENALFAKPILAGMPGRKVLLTSDYHMYRAWHCFRREGVDIIPRPFPDLLKRARSFEFRWPGFLMLGRELITITYYRMRHWI